MRGVIRPRPERPDIPRAPPVKLTLEINSLTRRLNPMLNADFRLKPEIAWLRVIARD
jgi:hypothetical protein